MLLNLLAQIGDRFLLRRGVAELELGQFRVDLLRRKMLRFKFPAKIRQLFFLNVLARFQRFERQENQSRIHVAADAADDHKIGVDFIVSFEQLLHALHDFVRVIDGHSDRRADQHHVKTLILSRNHFARQGMMSENPINRAAENRQRQQQHQQ